MSRLGDIESWRRSSDGLFHGFYRGSFGKKVALTRGPIKTRINVKELTIEKRFSSDMNGFSGGSISGQNCVLSGVGEFESDVLLFNETGIISNDRCINIEISPSTDINEVSKSDLSAVCNNIRDFAKSGDSGLRGVSSLLGRRRGGLHLSKEASSAIFFESPQYICELSDGILRDSVGKNLKITIELMVDAYVSSEDPGRVEYECPDEIAFEATPWDLDGYVLWNSSPSALISSVLYSIDVK